jgi:hypothetical protein
VLGAHPDQTIRASSPQSDDAAVALPTDHRPIMTEPLPPDASSGLSGRRRALTWAVIVVASLIALGSTLTIWVHRQMLDTQAWKDASAQMIQDPQVREALSVYLVNELYDNVDAAAALEQRLPPNLKPLAAPAAGALRQPATDAVDRLLDAPRVQQLWINASSLAQQKLVNVLENKTGHGIATGNGVVTLDLGELVSKLGAELGLPAAALDKIPPGTGVITVMRSDQLAAAQAGVQTVRVLSTVLLVVVLALYGLAIYLARDARRRALRNVGWAVVLVGLTVLVIRRLAGSYAVDALTTPPSEAAGHRVWLIGSSILGDIGWAAIFYGVVVALAGVLAGPTAAATAVRRRIAPVLNDQPAVAWGTVTFVFLLLVLWGGTHALRTLWGIALLGALIAAGVVALRHQTLRELRDAGGVPTTSRDRSPAQEIAHLDELRAAGAITNDEFDRAKQIVLVGK